MLVYTPAQPETTPNGELVELLPKDPKQIRNTAVRLSVAAFVFLVLPFGALLWATTMPGTSWDAPPPPLSTHEQQRRSRLQNDVHTLAATIGPRHVSRMRGLRSAETFLLESLRKAGVPESDIERHEVRVPTGERMYNIVVERGGTSKPNDIVLIGAHYDTVSISPGADDNASGVAALLEIVRAVYAPNAAPLQRTLRIAFFVNEEEPFFQNEGMGSLTYARRTRARSESVLVAISLDMIGFYKDRPKSQRHSPLFRLVFSETANFVTFVSDVPSRSALQPALRAFRTHAKLPSEGLTAPTPIAQNDRSDHWSFRTQGYPGFVITDTAYWRNPHYHKITDTPETLDYTRLTLVTNALIPMLRTLTDTEALPRPKAQNPPKK